MKTSNQLIIALLTITLLAIIGTNMVLKAAYDKIDLKDAFYNFTREAAKPFKVVRLRGGHAGLVQIQPGKGFEVRVSKGEKDQVKWRQNGDTLELTYGWKGEPYRYRTGDAFYQIPTAYVIAPQLAAVYSTGVTCKLKDWQAAECSLRHEGVKSGMLLTNNTISSLSLVTRHGGLIQVESNNQMGKTRVLVGDTSSFIAKKDVFESIQIRADSIASVQLPGSLFRKLIQP